MFNFVPVTSTGSLSSTSAGIHLTVHLKAEGMTANGEVGYGVEPKTSAAFEFSIVGDAKKVRLLGFSFDIDDFDLSKGAGFHPTTMTFQSASGPVVKQTVEEHRTIGFRVTMADAKHPKHFPGQPANPVFRFEVAATFTDFIHGVRVFMLPVS